MLELPQVTLICLTNKDLAGHKFAMEMSCKGINFGAVKIIWDEKIKDINDWNYKVIYELPKYVSTEFAFLFHADGYIVNPECWQKAWLQYDYIGAPWPLPRDSYSYRDETGGLVRVGNSVSLRSKKLMDLIATTPKEYFWNKQLKWGNTNEDGYICCHNRRWLESQGCKFAPLEVAVHFSKEHEIEENKNIKTFAFHTTDLGYWNDV